MSACLALAVFFGMVWFCTELNYEAENEKESDPFRLDRFKKGERP